MSAARGIIGLSPLAFIFSFPIYAQTSPDAGSLLRQQEQLQQRSPAQLPKRDVEETRPPLTVGAGETVRVKTIRFSGATVLVPEAELQALVADAMGRELDFTALQQLAERTTAHLKQSGWFLARAYLPKQDVTEGNIEIALIAGRLSEKEPVRITAEGKLALRIDPERLKAIANRQLPAGAAAREDELNRAVLLMNDLPGVAVRARLEPGDQEGETRILLALDEGPLFSGNATVDNHGSRDTGIEQINASLNVNNPSGIGDQITAGVTESAGTHLARLGYSLPVGSNGIKLNFGYTDMRYTVRSATGRASGLTGESQTITTGVMMPWLRSRTANLYANLGLVHKALLDRSSAGTLRDKSVDTIGFSLAGDQLDNLGGGGLNSFSAGLTAGRLALNLASDATTDAAGYRTAGGYHKLSYTFSRLQKLPGAFTAFANFTGQQAGKNLDSSEKLYLGGPAGVRAYPGSEGGGDSAQILNLEARYDWPGSTPLGSLQLQAFYDAAWTQLHHDTRNIAIPTATQRNRYGIAGTGIGLSLTQASSHIIRMVYAGKLGDNPGRTTAGLDADSRADDARFWLQAIVLF
jgi:hemolysin activation/secretion protein